MFMSIPMFAIVKKPLLHRLFALFLLFSLAACNQAELIQKFTSPQEQAVAKQYIDLLRQRQFDKIEAVADPSIANENLHEALVAMADAMPPGAPTSISLVGAHRLQKDDSTTVNLTFEYGFGQKWFLTNVAVKTVAGKATITGFRLVPQSASLEEQNRFNLAGKNAMQIMVLALAVSALALTLFALVVCVRTRLHGRKWPWLLFILFGVGNLSVNWTTADLSFSPLAILMFSAAASAQLYGPWVLSVSMPLGAVVFLLRRKHLMREPAASSASSTSSDARGSADAGT